MMSFIKIKEVIDAWDPIDLWRSHCPRDEYDDEINQIATLIKDEIDKKRIAEIIYTVFITDFNEDLFRYKLEDCLEIAERILKN